MNTGYEMICVCEWSIPAHHKNNILMCKMINSRILGYCPFTNPKDVVQSVTTSNKRGGWINPCFFPFLGEVAQITKRISVPETDVKPVVQTFATRSWKCPVCSLQQFQVLDPSRGHQVNPIPLFVSPFETMRACIGFVMIYQLDLYWISFHLDGPHGGISKILAKYLHFRMIKPG